jgi:hypothetical protein
MIEVIDQSGTGRCNQGREAVKNLPGSAGAGAILLRGGG